MASSNKSVKMKSSKLIKGEAEKHVEELKRLDQTQPDFLAFLKEHDKDLLEFGEGDMEDSFQTDAEDEESEETGAEAVEHAEYEVDKEEEPARKVITSAMVDSWYNAIKDGENLSAVRSILRAFRSACHYGDENGDDASAKFGTMSSSVFNKIMLLVLNEMDGILRGLLKLPSSGGKKEMIMDLISTRKWKNYNNLVKSYLGNSLHVLNQMTDNEMIAFVLRRLKYSSIFLAAFPVLLRKYIKVALHFWGTGSDALPVVSFLFIRDICIRLGPDCLDDCIKGMYKAYVMNCQFATATKMQHLHFLSNCFVELLGVDISSAYQHAFVYIRQLAIILKETLSGSTKKKKTRNNDEPSGSKRIKGKDGSSNSSKKEAFRKVYQWKYVHCLELWTGVVCAYSSEPDIRPLAYPLVQIITGVARLVPSTCYFPLRVRCVKMLNRIGASTSTFIPVSLLLLDMLEIKELRRSPTGVGKAIDWFSTLKVSKATLKTRAFKEACVFSVVEELAEHLSQWSYSISFMELSFFPCVWLRNFCKASKIDRFHREIRHLIRQIESNSEYVNKKRSTVPFLPNSPAAASFLEDDMKSGRSPLSQYAAVLRQRALERNDSLRESSVLVGDGSSKFGSKIRADDEDDDMSEDVPTPVFSLPEFRPKAKRDKNVGQRKINTSDEDIIEDFVLSSDEDDAFMGDDNDDEEDTSEPEAVKQRQPTTKPKRQTNDIAKKRRKTDSNKSKKRKRVSRKS